MTDLIVVCGPTASGKTALAIALAKALDTEIVSADSLLVYRGLDIGTAKPTERERAGVPHHMIDIVSPRDSFSVSDYERLALPVLERLLAEGKKPILCGGTGFYLDALLYRHGYGGAKGDPALRKKYEAIAQSEGAEALHRRLAAVDPPSAQKLHPNDTMRIIRALEIFETTGKRKSDQHDERVPRFSFRALQVDYPREVLYHRIEERVDRMMEAGLTEEVASLLRSGVDKRAQCMQGIGYKEVVEGFEQGWSRSTMSDIIKRRTRNYAKRQITYFKRMEHLTAVSPNYKTEDILKLL